MRTSLQTNNSSGRVVNMFSPKQKRATLMRVSSYLPYQLSISTQARVRLPTAGKLLRIFPCVLFVNTQKAGMANTEQESNENKVDTCVTSVNRSMVGVFMLP